LDWYGGDSFSAEGRRSMASFLEKSYPGVWDKSFTWHDKQSREFVLQKMAEASFVIIPSIWETFGFTALEAASLGKPIIITSHTGASYLFTHKHDAWIIPAGDAKKMAEAIELLSNDPSLREKLGSNARKTIQAVFDEKDIVEERIKLFQSVIQNRQQQPGAFEQWVAFLKKYITPQRKLYYSFRSKLKKLAGR